MVVVMIMMILLMTAVNSPDFEFDSRPQWDFRSRRQLNTANLNPSASSFSNVGFEGKNFHFLLSKSKWLAAHYFPCWDCWKFGGLVVAQEDADKVELKRRDRFLPRLGDPPLFRQETRLWNPKPGQSHPPSIHSRHVHFWICFLCWSVIITSMIGWDWTLKIVPSMIHLS